MLCIDKGCLLKTLVRLEVEKAEAAKAVAEVENMVE